MSKFNSIILKIKLLYLITFRKIKNNKFRLDTSEFNKNLENVLIIFPNSEKNFKVAN